MMLVQKFQMKPYFDTTVNWVPISQLYGQGHIYFFEMNRILSNESIKSLKRYSKNMYNLEGTVHSTYYKNN